MRAVGSFCFNTVKKIFTHSKYVRQSVVIDLVAQNVVDCTGCATNQTGLIGKIAFEKVILHLCLINID